MSRLQAFFALVLAMAGLFLSAPARATINCTISGTVTLQSQDSYYCDEGILGTACNGWLEKNLDSTTVKMQYMLIGVFPANGAFKYTSTDANGDWSLQVPIYASQCKDEVVEIRYYFARVHEADAGFWYPRLRFVITDIDESGPVPGNTWRARSVTEDLDGPTTNVTCTWSRTSTVSHARWANIYYTASSFMKEVTQWSSNLDSSFSEPGYGNGTFLRIGVESTSPFTGLAQGPYAVIFHPDAYAAGASIRHELGHVTHYHAHKRERSSQCESYNFKGVGNHHPKGGCDYGPAAITEGIATFIATRSVTQNDTKSWFCSCVDGALGSLDWDICSDNAALTSDPDAAPSDNDWFFNCAGGTFWYLGDHRVSSPSNCNRLRSDVGCDCLPVLDGGWCEDAYTASHGYRNEVQVSRFFWDMIDTNNDSGMDDTGIDDFNDMDDFIAVMEAMPCMGNLGGVDGSCEEQAVASGEEGCDPPSAGQYWPDGGAGDTGTRDSYNVYDFSDIIPGSQSGERTLNCVQGALD